MNSPSVASKAAHPVLTLRGARAHSSFRLEKLLASLKAAEPDIRAVDSAFLHFVETTRSLSSQEHSVLEKLLAYGGSPADASSRNVEGELLLVIPRIGTISPWASKATDIAHNCGLPGIRRIERGTAYYVQSGNVLDKRARDAVVAAIHDPMTEIVCSTLADADRLFATQTPRPLSVVPVIKGGIAALARANVDMGLALSQDEVDYLFDYFQ